MHNKLHHKLSKCEAAAASPSSVCYFLYTKWIFLVTEEVNEHLQKVK